MIRCLVGAGSSGDMLLGGYRVIKLCGVWMISLRVGKGLYYNLSRWSLSWTVSPAFP